MDVRQLYKHNDASGGADFWGCSYTTLIEGMGKILFSQDIGSYQGDTLILLEKDDQYGYLCFGWGSCSGCDALHACSSYDELQSLYDSLESRIIWFNSKSEVKKWFIEHDWEGEYFYGSEKEELFNFKNQVLAWCDNE